MSTVASLFCFNDIIPELVSDFSGVTTLRRMRRLTYACSGCGFGCRRRPNPHPLQNACELPYVECRFIEHGRPPIYRVDTAGGRSFQEKRPAKKARGGVYVYREYTRSWRQLDGSMSGRGDLCDRSSSDKVTVRAASTSEVVSS